MADILLITPWYVPAVCGIGDYSHRLAEGLRERGHSVHILAGGDAGPEDNTHAVTRVADWSRGEVQAIAARVAREQYTHVLLQYAPSAYSRKGALPPIAGLPRAIKQAAPNCQVITTLHELFYITMRREWRRIPRNMTVGLGQRGSLLPLLRWSDVCVATTDQRQAFLARFMPYARIGRGAAPVLEIPIGTNIDVVPMMDKEKADLRRALGLDGCFVLGTFSAAWEADMVLAALQAARAAGVTARLLAVGMTEERLLTLAPARYPPLAEAVVCTGRLSSEDVSRHLQCVDLYLLPLIDGVSSRRTTLLAALSHGLPVVGTAGRTTDNKMRGVTALTLTRGGDQSAFTAAVLQMCRDTSRRLAMGHAARALYEAQYRWDSIAARYDKLIVPISPPLGKAQTSMETYEA